MNQKEKAAEKWANGKWVNCQGNSGNHVQNREIAKESFLAGWHERDKQPITLTDEQIDLLCRAAVNQSMMVRRSTIKRQMEGILNAQKKKGAKKNG